MQELKKVIKTLMKEWGIEKPVLQNKSLLIWKDVVGETIANNTEPEEVKHGILLVKVSTPVWRNELMFRKKEILEKLNTVLGEKVIKDIRLV